MEENTDKKLKIKKIEKKGIMEEKERPETEQYYTSKPKREKRNPAIEKYILRISTE